MKSDLYLVFQKLPLEKRRALRKFVESPYHNLRDDVKSLFRHLDKFADQDLDQLRKPAVHAALFPGEDYDDQRLRYAMSFLLKTIEQFLVQERANTDVVRSQLELSAAYRQMGLEKLTARALRRAQQLHGRKALHDASFYEKSYLLEDAELQFSQTQKRTAARNLQQVNHSLDLSYLAKKLRQSCTALVHGTVANVEYDSGLLDLVLGYLKEADWLDEHPAISLYFYFYQAATSDDEDYFEKLKNGMQSASEILPEAELRSLLFLAINFCIQKFNRGEERYLGEVFELYQNGLAQRILLIDGRLSRFAFKNIAGIAIRLGRFGWTEDFIKGFGEKIDLKHRRNYADFIRAKLFYARKNFGEAQRLLHNVEYEDVFLNLDAKVLLLKIYFELEETEVLDSFISTFQRFLNRKKELGYHRENYTNTLLFARRLLSLNPFDKMEKESLRSEIESAKAVGEREWLLERLS